MGPRTKKIPPDILVVPALTACYPKMSSLIAKEETKTIWKIFSLVLSYIILYYAGQRGQNKFVCLMGPQIQNLLRKSLKSLKSLKSGRIFFFLFLFTIFKGFTWNNICSLIYFKAKNEEKLKKNLKLFLGQKPFLPFLKN